MKSRCVIFAVTICSLFISSAVSTEGGEARKQSPPLILAHYMPWYVAKPHREIWGWHWTMNHFDPERIVDDQREIASHFYPLIGPYDSGDPDVLEYHLLLMKLAGIDGVIVDWYGLQEFRDYAILHHNTQKLVEQANRLGVEFAICYEDQTIPALVDAGRLRAEERVAHAVSEIQWLAEHWFGMDRYVRLDDRPVLLSFGHAGLASDEWSQCLTKLPSPVAYFSEHLRRPGALGGFDWPIPKRGLEAIERFQDASRNWPYAIPAAFPRFVDIYKEAGLHEGYGRVEDNQGATFRRTLALALAMKPPMIQITTWNDWGEGTVIEPSREFGYRDLEVLQEMRRRYLDPQFSATSSDLRLPLRLIELRRGSTGSNVKQQLDRIAELIAKGNIVQARSALETLPSPP